MTLRSAASASPAAPSAMPTCRRWEWSTITRWTVSAGGNWEADGFDGAYGRERIHPSRGSGDREAAFPARALRIVRAGRGRVPGGPGADPVRVLEPAHEGPDGGASRRPFPRPGAVRGVGGTAFRLLSRRRAPRRRGGAENASSRLPRRLPAVLARKDVHL